jgi:hypothetical protein
MELVGIWNDSRKSIQIAITSKRATNHCSVSASRKLLEQCHAHVVQMSWKIFNLTTFSLKSFWDAKIWAEICGFISFKMWVSIRCCDSSLLRLPQKSSHCQALIILIGIFDKWQPIFEKVYPISLPWWDCRQNLVCSKENPRCSGLLSDPLSSVRIVNKFDRSTTILFADNAALMETPRK